MSEPDMELLDLKQVVKMTSLKRSTLLRYVKDKKFPTPVKIGDNRIAWIKSEVEDFIKKKIKEHRNV